MSADHLAKMVAEHMWSKDEAAQLRGIVLRSVAAGKAQMQIQVSQSSLNALGICDGGIIFALAETAFLYAANSYNRRAVSQHAAISYFAQVKSAQSLTATARELSRSGRSATYAVEVRSQDETLIAELRGQSRVVRGEWLQSFAP